MVLSDDVTAMTFTNDTSTSLNIDGMLMDSATIGNVLREARTVQRSHVVELVLRNVSIDDVVAQAAEDLFASSTTSSLKSSSSSCSTDDANDSNIQQPQNQPEPEQERIWNKIDINHCTGEISRWIRACIGCVKQLQFTGSVPIAHNPRYSLDLASLQFLGQALQQHPQLTVLILRGTRLSYHGLQAFCVGLAHSQTLHTLQMSHCALEEPEHVTILADAIQQNQSLTTYQLSHCRFGATFHTNTTNANGNDNDNNAQQQQQQPQLQPHHPNQDDDQDNNNNGETDIELSDVQQLHPPRHDFFPTLLEALVDHPKLQSLNIHGMYCNSQAIQALSNLLLRSPCLWHLGLKNNLRHPDDKIQITTLLQALRGNSKLTYLQISGNNVDSDDMIQLAHILSTGNATLRAISLTANTIDDRGLSEFAEHLCEMKALRFLDVQRNPITQVSKSQMIKSLKDNVELERLDMDGTYDATKAYYLGLNRGGRRLLQSNPNNCPLSLWPVVLARVNKLPFGRNQATAHANVLYCLLVQGPILFQPNSFSSSSSNIRSCPTTTSNSNKRRGGGVEEEEEEKKAEENLPSKAKRSRTLSNNDLIDTT